MSVKSHRRVDVFANFSISEASSKILRYWQIWPGLILIGFVLSYSYFHLIDASQKEESSTQVIDSIGNQERDLDNFITSLEQNFLKFGAELEPKIEAISNDGIQKNLQLPFLLIKLNQQNPYKNHLTLLRQSSQLVGQDGLFCQDDINYFSYDFSSDQSQNRPIIPALPFSFCPAERVVRASPIIGQQNVFDFLILYHELVHASQDTDDRAALQTQKQFDFYRDFYAFQPGQKPRIIIDYEVAAYAFEFEIFNLLVDGELKKSADSGQVDIASLAEKIRLRPDQRQDFNLTCQLALNYFSHGLNGTKVTEEFFDDVKVHYQKIGYAIFTIAESGELVELLNN